MVRLYKRNAKGKLVRFIPKGKARVRKMRMYRRVADVGQIVKFKETFDSGLILPNVAQTPYKFTLNSIPQLANYQALYKNYKITGVKIQFFPGYSGTDPNQVLANTAGGITSIGNPRLTISTQRGHMASSITSELQLLQREHAMHTFCDGKPWSIFIKKPVAALDVDSAGGLTNNSMYQNGWLDLASSADVNHNGLEYYLTAPASSSSVAGIKVFTTIYFVCKNQA